jgi:hypothetical protein
MSGSTVAASGGAVVNGQFQRVVYVFTKPAASPWTDMTESAQLRAAGAAPSLGSVGMSGDGNTIIALGPGEVCVFVKPAGGWQGTITPVAKLSQSLPPKSWILQGTLNSVAINAKGDTIVAGAYDAGTQGHRSDGKEVQGVAEQGAVYVWVEPTGGWVKANGATQTAKLTASDGVAFDEFGWSVGIAANTIVAGAPAFSNGRSTGHGAAYVFTRPASGVWRDTARFKSKFTATDEKYLDGFGDLLAVGNSGALVALGSGEGQAYVFARESTSWPTAMTQTAELTPSDTSGGGFGQGLAVGNSLVVVGAPNDGNGVAYSFVEPTTGWADMSLPASMIGGSDASQFGTSSHVGGRSTAVGAPETSVNGNNGAGTVYIFSN